MMDVDDARLFLAQFIDGLVSKRDKATEKETSKISPCSTSQYGLTTYSSDSPSPAKLSFFTAENAKAIFESFDASRKGWISLEQYNAAMNSMLIKHYNREPKGFVEGRIAQDTFLEEW